MSEETSHCSPLQQTSSGNLLRQVGQLVRTTSTPHAPIWITGANYPAQYLIRQTRSMTARFTTIEHTLVISIPLNKIVLPTRRQLLPVLSLPVETLDFYLPDKIFLKLKLQKLKQIEESQKIISQRRVTPQDEECVCYPVNVSSQSDTSSKSNTINLKYMLDDISRNLTKTTSSLQTGTKLIIPSVWLFPDHDISCKISCRMTDKDGVHMNSMIYTACIVFHEKEEEEDHDKIGWFIDNSGNYLLLVTLHSLWLYKVIIDGVDLIYNLKHGEHVLENIFCLQLLYKEIDEVLFAVIGSRECICWVFQWNKTPCRLSLYSKDDNNVVGLCDIWTNNNDIIVTYTCTFPVTNLWCCILKFTSECQWIISKQYKLPLDKAPPIHCLCHVNETSYIVGVASIHLFIWDYLSASLLRQVQLQCSPDKGVEPSLPMILTAFIEDKVHLFLVMCTTTCNYSCCWLILVTMTMHECVGELSPYMIKSSGQDVPGGAHLSQLVMTYKLPSNTNERVIQYRIASSKQLAASLSNNDIILWDLLQSYPVAKISLSGIKMDSFAWPQNNILWIVSNNCLHLFKKNNKI